HNRCAVFELVESRCLLSAGTLQLIATNTNSSLTTMGAGTLTLASGSTLANASSIDGNSIVGKYTYFGDMDLDGQLTPGDYDAIDGVLATPSFTTVTSKGLVTVACTSSDDTITVRYDTASDSFNIIRNGKTDAIDAACVRGV